MSIAFFKGIFNRTTKLDIMILVLQWYPPKCTHLGSAAHCVLTRTVPLEIVAEKKETKSTRICHTFVRNVDFYVTISPYMNNFGSMF